MIQERMTIGDYVNEYSVRNKANENIPVYSVTNSQGFCKEYFNKEVASKDKSTYKIVPRGYFAYNPSRINVGSVDWQRNEERVIVSPLYNVFSVSDELDKQYLFYFLKSDIGRQMIKAKAFGSVRDNLKLDMLKEMTIPKRTIKEQKKCAAVLDKLKEIISLHTERIGKYDELIKARFVEMFGSINNNIHRFDIRTLQDVCEQIKDGTHQTPTYTEDAENGFKFLSSKDVTSGKIDWSKIKYIPAELHEELYARIKPQKGDILLAKNGTTGVSAVVETDDVFDIYVSLALLRPIDMNSVYLWAAINSAETKHQFDESLKGIGVPNLHLGEIKKTKIIVPPIEFQEEFEQFVHQVDKSKFVYY